MRVNLSFYLVAFLALSGVFMMSGTASAQDLFLKKDRGSSTSSGDDTGGSSNLYLSPKSGNAGSSLYRSDNRERRLYNNSDGRSVIRRAEPSTVINRDNELDRVQQANIDGAQARAVRNAQVVQEMQKVWDAERAAADEEAMQQYMAEQGQAVQGQQGTQGSAKDLSNAEYLKKNSMGLETPTRTFDVFR